MYLCLHISVLFSFFLFASFRKNCTSYVYVCGGVCEMLFEESRILNANMDEGACRGYVANR